METVPSGVLVIAKVGFLSSNFFLMQDENISSDDDEDVGCSDGADPSNAEAEDEDEGRHIRMLQEITGMPSETFQGNGFLSSSYLLAVKWISHD